MNYKIEKLSEFLYEAPAIGAMKVPLRIYASESTLQKMRGDKSIEQGMNVACLPGIYKYSIMMPDAHQGYGFPIGEVAAFDIENGIISPGGIGYDINCGVRVLASKLLREDVEPKINSLLDKIFMNIPCGIGEKSHIRLNDAELDNVLNKGIKWAGQNGYAEEGDSEKCEESGSMQNADASLISSHARERGRSQLGTLGAGNHFAEVQIVEKIYDKETAQYFGITEENQITVMIHTGSRGLGHQTCTDYLRIAEQQDFIHSLPDRELAYFPASSLRAHEYFGAMCAAANFAWCNRQIISSQMRKAFSEVFGPMESKLSLIYDVAHNIAKIETHKINGKPRKVYVHRKGATRAFGPGHAEIPEIYRKLGQPILIPGSMGTASYILIGTDKAMDDTFGSTAHGAGREMSRHEAIKKYNADKLYDELLSRHIHIRSASRKGISEEAPGAYKNIDEIAKISDAAGIGKIVVKLKPLGVIKG